MKAKRFPQRLIYRGVEWGNKELHVETTDRNRINRVGLVDKCQEENRHKVEKRLQAHLFRHRMVVISTYLS